MRTTTVVDALRGYRLFLDRHANSGDPLDRKVGLSPHQFAAEFMSSPEFMDHAGPRLLNGSRIAPPDLQTLATSLFDLKLGVGQVTHWHILYAVAVEVLQTGNITNEETRARLTRLLNLTSGAIKNAIAVPAGDASRSTDNIVGSGDTNASVFVALLGRMPSAEEQEEFKARTATPAALAAQIASSEEFRNCVVFPTLIQAGDTQQLEEPAHSKLNNWCAEAFRNPDCRHATIRAHRIAAILRAPDVSDNIVATVDSWQLNVLTEALLALPRIASNLAEHKDLLPHARNITNVFELLLQRRPESIDVYINKWRMSAADLFADVASGLEFGGSVVEPLLSGELSPHITNDFVAPSLAAWAWLTFGVDPMTAGPMCRFELLARIMRSPTVTIALSLHPPEWKSDVVADALQACTVGEISTTRRQSAVTDGLPTEYEDILSAMFSADDYRTAANIGDLKEEEAWRHYLEIGLPNDTPPSLLFSVDFLRKRYPAWDGAPPLAIRWLDDFFKTGQPSTPFFDPIYYLNAGGERSAASTGFLHYLRSGRHQGWNPNAAFDHNWYAQRLPADALGSGTSAFEHFLGSGLINGSAPRQTLLSVFDGACDTHRPSLADYERLCVALAPFSTFLDPSELDLLLGLWTPSAVTERPIDGLIGWLEKWPKSVHPPSPLFDEGVYLAECTRLGLSFARSELAMTHFFAEGRAYGAVPTRFIDIRDYLACNPDLPRQPAGAFEHFVRIGLYEGRRTNTPKISEMALAYIPERGERPELKNWRMFWTRRDVGVPVWPDNVAVREVQARIDSTLDDPQVMRMLARAREIDPAARLPTAPEKVYGPPIHDAREVARRRIRGRLKTERYDTIICVSGTDSDITADAVKALTDALLDICPGQRVLVLLTEGRRLFERLHLRPDVECVDISHELTAVGETQAEFLLYSLLVRICSGRVIALGSYRCWSVFRRFGERMRGQFTAFGYLQGELADGPEMRPSISRDFIAETASFLSGVLTDSNHLRNALINTYRPSPDVAARITALYNPLSAPPLAHHARASARPAVGWSGALDRGNAFSILRAVAARIPEVDFECWNNSGSGIDPSATAREHLPYNIRVLTGPVNTTAVDQVDVWLSTSATDGISPTLFLAAQRSKALIAGLAGALSEFVNDRTGWPVRDIANVDDYVAAIRQALASPDQRGMRGDKLRASVMALHDGQRYAAQLAAALNPGTQQ